MGHRNEASGICLRPVGDLFFIKPKGGNKEEDFLYEKENH
jgi:hypothetical protein